MTGPAGNRDKRITLLAPQKVERADGSTALTHRPAFSVWADVRTTAGRELVRNNQIEVELAHYIRILWRADVNEEWQIDFRGRTLRIAKALDVAGRGEELEIVAFEARGTK